MKKFLSLVLALVMAMSLVTISAGAKSFSDNSSIEYKEAVAVVSALDIVDGYTDGSFGPTNVLTRQAAAKIICNLILGRTTADALSANDAPYKDVPVTSQFAGYIAYCANKGIISGYADGTFRPTGTLTGYAFMKMLLGALEYDSEIEGFVGENWSINVAKLALNIGLDDGNDNFVGTAPVTREEACLYAFNTLQADIVEYENKTSVVVNGATVNIGNNKAKAMRWQNSATNDGGIEADGYIQFAEQYFTKLKKTDETDAFGRPSTKWTNKGTKIGSYTETADLTYSDSVKLNQIYADLGMTTAATDYELYVNGVLADNYPKHNVKKADDTKLSAIDSRIGKGTIVEVFYDDDDNSVIVAAISVYAGKITDVKDATSTKDAYVIVEPSTNAPATITTNSGSDEFETTAFEEDDIVAYTYSDDTKEIKTMYKMDSVEGSLTRRVATKSVTIDGTVYTYGKNYGFDSSITEDSLTNKSDYVVYLDEYGYALYIDELESNVDTYALLLSVQDEGAWNNARAKLLFSDGTKKTVNTAKDYETGSNAIAVNTIVSYKVEEDGDYKLTAIKNQKNSATGAFQIDKDNKSIKGLGTSEADSKTIFVVEDGDDYDVYTGIKKAPKVTNANAFAYVKDDTAKLIFVMSGTVKNSSKDFTFIAAETAPKLTKSDDSDNYYVYNAVVAGEITTIMIGENATVTGALNAFAPGADTYKSNDIINDTTTDSDDIITSADFDNNDVQVRSVTGVKKVSEEEVKLGGRTLSYARGVEVYYIDEDGNIEDIGVDGVKTNSTNNAIYVLEDGEITYLFIQKV